MGALFELRGEEGADYGGLRIERELREGHLKRESKVKDGSAVWFKGSLDDDYRNGKGRRSCGYRF